MRAATYTAGVVGMLRFGCVPDRWLLAFVANSFPQLNCKKKKLNTATLPRAHRERERERGAYTV